MDESEWKCYCQHQSKCNIILTFHQQRRKNWQLDQTKNTAQHQRGTELLAGLRWVFASDPAVSSSIFVSEKLIWNDPDKSEFLWKQVCSLHRVWTTEHECTWEFHGPYPIHRYSSIKTSFPPNLPSSAVVDRLKSASPASFLRFAT